MKTVKIGQKVYKVEVADTFFSRLKGLLGRDTLERDTALLITPCNSIHTHFMKFPISVIFVDKKGIVKKVKHNVTPWKMVNAFDSYAVYEINAEYVNENILPKVGDKIEEVC